MTIEEKIFNKYSSNDNIDYENKTYYMNDLTYDAFMDILDEYNSMRVCSNCMHEFNKKIGQRCFIYEESSNCDCEIEFGCNFFVNNPTRNK